MRASLALAAVLASQAGDTSCDTAARSAGYDCHVDTRGLRNENGLVVDIVTNWCNEKPQRQAFTVWIEARPGPDERWEQVGRSAINFSTPGLKGSKTRVEGGRCQPDIEYSVAWQAEGVTAEGVPYDLHPDSDLFGTTGLC